MDTVDIKKNFFELFNLPTSFDIDVNDLSSRFLKLQNLTHPDKHASSSDLQRRIAVQQSAYINQAFQTLRNPLQRAKYLLMLHGIDIDNEKNISMEPAFLMQQMELREQLESIRTSHQPTEELAEVEMHINDAIRRVSSLIETSFRSNSVDMQAVKNYVCQMQFLTKLDEDANTLQEELL